MNASRSKQWLIMVDGCCANSITIAADSPSNMAAAWFIIMEHYSLRYNSIDASSHQLLVLIHLYKVTG